MLKHKKRTAWRIWVLTLFLVLTILQPAHALPGGDIQRVSLASDSSQGNGDSYSAAFSADGRYVAFESDASNLVPGDTNGFADIFVHDRQTGATERVSVASDSAQANDISYVPAISADGRYVVFYSAASNLAHGDTNNSLDIFVHDRQTSATERVSLTSDGAQANNDSIYPAISADGRYVVFSSDASNLVSGDTNDQRDIFVHDRQTDITERVSLTSDGAQANNDSIYPAISADGRYVVFSSGANNLVSGDTNGQLDIFVHDRQADITERVSVASDGAQGNDVSYDPAISADGRYVVFYSAASNLAHGDTNNSLDIFVHDRQTSATERVSLTSDGTQGNDDSIYSAISADGRYVVFSSDASNLVSGDTNDQRDIFVHNRQTGITERVSVASDGAQGNDDSYGPAISTDGRYVVFSSNASNLVPGDTNGYDDSFIRDRWPEAIFMPLTVK